VRFTKKLFRKWDGTGLSRKTTTDNEPIESSLKSDTNPHIEQTTINWSSLYKKEDWWAVWIGLTIFALSLPSYFGIYLLGWIPVAKPWMDIGHALSTKVFDPWIGLIASFIFLALIMIPVNRFNGVKSKDWFKGFFVIFFTAWIIYLLSNYSPIVKVIGSAEVGYVIALLVGIAITNLFRIPSWLKNSARGELFIKAAIVLLGAKILLTSFVTSAPTILVAAFLSFPVVWIIAFLISKKLGLDKNLSATLSSGVGICGVSASIATAAAIEAPAIYSTVISSIIVIFSAIEIIVMPFVAANFFPTYFDAAGVWMGLSVKTDGAASASASIVDGLLKANGSALNAAVITKVMIDIWIGLISFLLATVWAYKVKKQTNINTSPMVLWYKFPKFVLGYLVTSIILSLVALSYQSVAEGAKAVAPVISFGTEPLRTVFFTFTFFSIGLGTQFSKFKEINIKKPIIAYAISLCFAIVWGGIISYLLFVK
jgi:uncharacterized membrane protein YadS